MAKFLGNFWSFNSPDKKAKASPYSEAGISAIRAVGGWLQPDDKNPKLNPQFKQTSYNEIVYNLSIVGASMRIFLDSASKAKWKSTPANDTAEAKAVAEFADRLMEDLDTSWSRVHRQAATFKYFGASVLEWTARRADDGKITFSSIEPRRNETIIRWDIDEDGTILGIEQRAPISGQLFYIPRHKFAYFVDDAFTDQPDGIGLLRHIFPDTQRLESLFELENMSFDKDVRGIPVARIPYAALARAVKNGELTKADAERAISSAESMVKMQRKKPGTGLALDSATYESRNDNGINVTGNRQWDFEILSAAQSGISDLDKAINRYQTQIARALSTEFLLLGATGAGSLALSKSKMQSFLLMVNSTNVDIVERANKDLLEPILKLNGISEELFPRWDIEDVREEDVEMVVAAVKDLASAGATLVPGDPAIDEIRQAVGLSPVPEGLNAAGLV